MNKAKRILTHHRLANALYSTQPTPARSIRKLVTHAPHFSTSLLVKNRSLINFSSYNKGLFFSSKPESFLEILSSDDWPKKLEKELKDSNLVLTHETVVYVLKKLSKAPKNASKFLKWAVGEKGFEPNSSIYSLVLRIYANKELMKEFWVTIKEMRDKGYYLDEETYRTICSTFRGLRMENEATALRHFYERLIQENVMEDRVKEVVDVIKSCEWGEEVERKLEEMEIKVSDNFMLRVFKELRGKGHPLRAHRFFKWAEGSLGFKHNGVTYNGMLRVLCWEESISEFWGVLEEMKGAGFELDIDTYIKVSRQLQKNKMVGDGVKLYEHMMDSSFKPSDTECSLLLRAIATSSTPNIDLMYRVVKKYEASGHSFSKQIYDGIHRSLTSLGKFDEAEEIVEKMRDAGFEPDNITYSQLVFGLCKARRFDEAAEVLDTMEERGCPPDIKTWTILIKGHCAANEISDALACFTKMTEKGFDADADLLDVLIGGFMSQSRAVGAYELLMELVQRARLRPWQATFKNLIQKLLAESKLEEAMELLRLMKKHNYPPFPEPFVQHISKFGSVEDAWEFLTALSVKEHPTVSAYQHVFKSFFNEGRHSEAKDLLFKCPHHIRKHPAICSLFGSAI
ncbi:pentatricopeptide repeat-containing protein At3g48250, chloroplastic [Salvia hispanica]|uniref:pentatricopeptide repeat-containing protein At3g48250, chloroplastic n=1 Tax=Salvia hispanica TaxID=49212 RepID=UPI00200957DC|nr:pentatricopeptide repeat-containing protein At3g48250, chloroplastic [Salvia hispanica]